MTHIQGIWKNGLGLLIDIKLWNSDNILGKYYFKQGYFERRKHTLKELKEKPCSRTTLIVNTVQLWNGFWTLTILGWFSDPLNHKYAGIQTFQLDKKLNQKFSNFLIPLEYKKKELREIRARLVLNETSRASRILICFECLIQSPPITFVSFLEFDFRNIIWKLRWIRA